MSEILVEKNDENELPIPSIWRPTFSKIVKAFVEKDYKIERKIDNVTPISEDTAKQIKKYIEDYGEKLIDLPNETWNSSVYMYYGTYWNVLIDLFTESEGLSDLALSLEVREVSNEYEFEVKLVLVP